jgi:hypothetical protein
MTNSLWANVQRFLLHAQTPVWVGLFFVAGSMYLSTIESKSSRQVAIAQIQQTLRERFLNYRPVQESLQIDLYPSQIRSYSKKQRYQIRRYWSEIVFNEFVTISSFGGGIMRDNWSSPYGDWAADALNSYAVLREEYCAFIEEDKAYLGPYAPEFKEKINTHYNLKYPNTADGLNCDALRIQRNQNTSN